jgi:hypothetical protein
MNSSFSRANISARSPMPMPQQALFKHVNVPSPAFRQGGRGSKQVSAALDALVSSPARTSSLINTSSSNGSSISNNNNSGHNNNTIKTACSPTSPTAPMESCRPNHGVDCRAYVLFNGRQSPCFARVVKEEHEGKDSILLQPLRPSFANPNLLIPWAGHLWSAKRSKCREVKVSSCRYFLRVFQ